MPLSAAAFEAMESRRRAVDADLKPFLLATLAQRPAPEVWRLLKQDTASLGQSVDNGIGEHATDQNLVGSTDGSSSPVPATSAEDRRVARTDSTSTGSPSTSLTPASVWTLASGNALEHDASIHWNRHIPSLAAFGVATHHIWEQIRTDKSGLVVLMQYADGADPDGLIKQYMISAEFRVEGDGRTLERR